MDQAISCSGPVLTGQESVERQLEWKPKFIEVNKQRFLVELWPVWTDALSALIATRRDPFARHEEGVDEAGLYLREEDYELKGCLNVFYVSEGFELEVLVRIEPDQLKERFPAEILLPGLKGDLKPCTQVQARVVWSNGDKQSATCSVRHTSNDDFDLIQSVRRERRIRGIEGEERCVAEPETPGVWADEVEAAELEMVVYGSDPSFVRHCFLLDGEEFWVELGPRMRRVYNSLTDPDDAGACDDYAQLKDVTFVGERETLVVRLLWDEKPLPFPKSVTLKELSPTWERDCDAYGLVEFGDGMYLPVRGYRKLETSASDRSAVSLKRFRDDPPAIGAGDQAPSERREGKAPRACRFRIKREGEAVEYNGKTYEFTETTAWKNLHALIHGGGDFVRCDKGLKKFFKSKDAKAFYNVAIQPKGAGRKGDGTYRLNI